MLQLAVAAAVSAAAVPSAPSAPSPHMSVALLASSERPRPGSTVLLGFRFTPQPGWHGYWSNPGGSGIAPTVTWSVPSTVHPASLQHPAPTLLQTMGLVSYVHSGEHVLLSRVRIDRAVAAGTQLPITAHLSWAACSDRLCVPEHATLSLALVAGDGQPSPAAPLLVRAAAREPRPVAGGSFFVDDGKLVLQLPAAARLGGADVRFFPDDNGFFDAARARTAAGPPVRISTPLGDDPPDVITGVASDGARAYRLSLHAGKPAQPAATPADPPVRATVATGPQAEPNVAPERAGAIQERGPAPLGRRLKQLAALAAIAALSVAALKLARRRYR